MVFWALWNSRNKFIFENQQLPPHLIVSNVFSYWEAFQASQESPADRPMRSVATTNDKWSGPAPGILKCNVDGAWQDGKAGIGLIVRDSKGKIILSGIFPVIMASCPLHVEILAVLKGIEVATEFNLTRIWLETDCLGVLHGVESNGQDKSVMGHLFSEIKERGRRFDLFSLLYTRRTTNFPAHKLAQLGMSASESCIWYADVPVSVTAAVAADLG